jgi:membrane protein
MGRGQKYREQWSRFLHFWKSDLWEIDPQTLSRVRLFWLKQAQIVAVVYRDFFNDGCLIRASALTYVTLLSIVPLLALMFAMLKGLGVQNALEPVILEHLAIGSEQVISEVVRYINNTNVGRLGTFGLVFLVFATLTLLSNIEKSFNHVWGVKETRPLFRRFADYFSVVVIGPIFILVAISMTTTLQSQGVVRRLLETVYVGHFVYFLFQVIPYVFMWIAFAGLYIFMPNIKVSPKAALVGGIFGGTIWQLCQWGYVHFQFGVARYNAIYGTMAALPILMVWLYLSWVIVLMGLEVTYASQNLRTIQREIQGDQMNFASRELIALTMLAVVSETFYRGERPWNWERISVELELPPRLTKLVLTDLVRLGFLSQVDAGAGETAYQPARALETVPIDQVLRAFREDGISYTKLRPTPEREAVLAIEERIRSAQQQALADTTMDHLVKEMMANKEGAACVLPGERR